MTRERRRGPASSTAANDPERRMAVPGKQTQVDRQRLRSSSGGAGKDTGAAAPRHLDLSLPEGFDREPSESLRRVPDENEILRAKLEEPPPPEVDDKAELLKSLPPYLQEAAHRKGLPVPGVPGAFRPAMLEGDPSDLPGSQTRDYEDHVNVPGIQYTLDF